MIKKVTYFLSFAICLFGFHQAEAIYSTSNPQNSIDIGFSNGVYEQKAYSEISVGYNWWVADFLIWRNAVFVRQVTSSVVGLDSSLRYVLDWDLVSQNLGLVFFGGPGVRFADTRNNAFFAEGGVVLKTRGFALGGGLKSMYYQAPGSDEQGRLKSKSDNSVFMIIAIGGGF